MGFLDKAIGKAVTISGLSVGLFTAGAIGLATYKSSPDDEARNKQTAAYGLSSGIIAGGSTYIVGTHLAARRIYNKAHPKPEPIPVPRMIGPTLPNRREKLARFWRDGKFDEGLGKLKKWNRAGLPKPEVLENLSNHMLGLGKTIPKANPSYLKEMAAGFTKIPAKGILLPALAGLAMFGIAKATSGTAVETSATPQPDGMGGYDYEGSYGMGDRTRVLNSYGVGDRLRTMNSTGDMVFGLHRGRH